MEMTIFFWIGYSEKLILFVEAIISNLWKDAFHIRDFGSAGIIYFHDYEIKNIVPSILKVS